MDWPGITQVGLQLPWLQLVWPMTCYNPHPWGRASFCCDGSQRMSLGVKGRGLLTLVPSRSASQMSMTLGEITSTSWHVYSTAVECQEKKRLPGCRNASSGQWREATYRQRSLDVTWNHPPPAAHPTEGRTRRSQSRDTQTFTHFEGVDNGRSCSKWLQRLQASCDIKHLQCVSQEKKNTWIRFQVIINFAILAINCCILPVLSLGSVHMFNGTSFAIGDR